MGLLASLHTGSIECTAMRSIPAQREEQSSVRLSSRTTNLEQPGRHGAPYVCHTSWQPPVALFSQAQEAKAAQRFHCCHPSKEVFKLHFLIIHSVVKYLTTD